MSSKRIGTWLCAAVVLGLTAGGCSEVKGDRGDPGVAGVQGATGLAGVGGLAGSIGPTGLSGQSPAAGLHAVIATSTSAGGGGTYFGTGETITFTVTFTDDQGGAVAATDIKTANLYVYGPKDQSRCKTAVALLGAETDRSKRPHHYIDLTKSGTPLNNTISFTTNPVGAEEAGTYTATVWAAAKAGPYDQDMPVKDFQVKTATVETEAVIAANSCAKCHQGADSGKYYYHHIDPGYSPTGNWALDAVAVQSCKGCHNQDGYAAYHDSSNTPDPIINRVHGVHMGEHLTSPENTHKLVISNVTAGTGTTGTDFVPAVPGDPRTTPADKVVGKTSGAEAKVFGSDGLGYLVLGHVKGAFLLGETVDVLDQVQSGHSYSYQNLGSANAGAFTGGHFEDYTTVIFPAGVTNCTTCHEDDRWKEKPSLQACGTCHDNTYFGASATPDGWADHVGGPQADDSACASCHPDDGPIAPTGNPNQYPIETVHEETASTPQHTFSLSMTAPANTSYYVAGETPKVLITVKDASNATVSPATITAADWNTLRFFVYGPRNGQAKPVLTSATATQGTYSYNDIRKDKDTKGDWTTNPNAIEYQLTDVAGLEAGTYIVYAYGKKGSSDADAYAKITFQVGSATVDKYIATNCADCHGNEKMHGSRPFDTDVCLACHDYGQRQADDSAWDAFGADPIVMKVHAVHYGAYLGKPEAIHSVPPDYSGVIFPQDVRNCTKCHSETTSYNENPPRMACGSCHDSVKAEQHIALNTADPTPAEPWSLPADEVETCVVCHGKDRSYEAKKVHNISDPYRPPYAR